MQVMVIEKVYMQTRHSTEEDQGDQGEQVESHSQHQLAQGHEPAHRQPAPVYTMGDHPIPITSAGLNSQTIFFSCTPEEGLTAEMLCFAVSLKIFWQHSTANPVYKIVSKL